MKKKKYTNKYIKEQITMTTAMPTVDEKNIMKPEISIVEILSCSMLSTSVEVDTNSQGDFKEDFVRGHRGRWGNLWDNEERI